MRKKYETCLLHAYTSIQLVSMVYSLFSTPNYYYIPFLILFSSQFPPSMIKQILILLPFLQNYYFSQFISYFSCLFSFVSWVPHWPWQLKFPWMIITEVVPILKIELISQLKRYFIFFYSFLLLLFFIIFWITLAYLFIYLFISLIMMIIDWEKSFKFFGGDFHFSPYKLFSSQ